MGQMSSHSFLLLLLATLAVQFSKIEARGRRPSVTSATTDDTTADTTVFKVDDTSEDEGYVTLVKSYLDDGTCPTTSTSTICGDDAASYYKHFEYNGLSVVISNGIPDHPAEEDALNPNPNERCEIWQFMAVPINPTKASTPDDTGMGVTALATTGGTFYNYLSDPFGGVALYNEGPSLDSCMGHSDQSSQYHYHANLLCDDAGAATGASDADKCVLVGYMRDGVPLYGYCKDSSGTQFTSCYSVSISSTAETIITAGGDFEAASDISDYEFDQDAFDAATCNLDMGSGAIHPTMGQYSYFLTAGYPFTPIYYYGEEGASDLCGAAV